jgi:hypothetical protein
VVRTHLPAPPPCIAALLLSRLDADAPARAGSASSAPPRLLPPSLPAVAVDAADALPEEEDDDTDDGRGLSPLAAAEVAGGGGAPAGAGWLPPLPPLLWPGNTCAGNGSGSVRTRSFDCEKRFRSPSGTFSCAKRGRHTCRDSNSGEGVRSETFKVFTPSQSQRPNPSAAKNNIGTRRHTMATSVHASRNRESERDHGIREPKGDQGMISTGDDGRATSYGSQPEEGGTEAG